MDFLELTKEGLDIPEEKMHLLAARGFEIFDDKKENAVLILGLNPSGYDDVADFERNTNRTHLYSIETQKKYKSNWVYNSYFKPIFSFVNAIYDDVKWPWCNKKYEDLKNEIKNSELSLLWDDIDNIYKSHAANKHTIYIGDMFYYHATASAELPTRNGYNYTTYCKKMLRAHIDKLKQNNKTIDFVYINNAQVSHWLCENKNTNETIDDVHIFYGPMLSGIRAIDGFSRMRLIQEVKSIIGT